MAKYSPLAKHLTELATFEVRFTFEEIEQILGSELPPSARQYDAWWANSRSDDSHTWAHLWLNAGWERAEYSKSEGWVVFRRVQHYELEDAAAVEGYERDAKVILRGRNAQLSLKRKAKDDYTCQACGFRLELNGRFVIEVHHLEPLAVSGEKLTRIEELVSLCPTCHRIAHLRSVPYTLEEIKGLRFSPPHDG